MSDIKKIIMALFEEPEEDIKHINANITSEKLDEIRRRLDCKTLFFIKRDDEAYYLKSYEVAQHNFSSDPDIQQWTTTIRIVGTSHNIVITLNGTILYNIMNKEIFLVDKVVSDPIPIRKKRYRR